MPKDYNNHIESFSIDYREESKPIKHKSNTKPVTGHSLPIKKEKDIIKKKNTNVYPRTVNKKEKEAPKYEVYINTKSKNPYRGVIIALTIILTIIGVGIFTSALNKTSIMTAEPISYNSFNGFLYPVVMQDPGEFSSPENADKNVVISSSIWMTIFRNKVESYNNFDDQGYALIPISEIKESCLALFCNENLINFSETIHGPFFYYNPGEESMHVGAISNQGRPLPQIKDVKENEKELIFTVDYVLIGSPEEDSNQRDVIKTMIYTMRLNEKTDKYYIYSVQKAG